MPYFFKRVCRVTGITLNKLLSVAAVSQGGLEDFTYETL